MIRQAISCDICGRDKQQTNHWFVAYEHGSELRISGWNSQVRMSTKAKHLCGQTCMHKLVDDFMARSIASRVDAGVEEGVQANQVTAASRGPRTDTSLTLASTRTLPMRAPVPVAPLYTDEYASSARTLSLGSEVRNQEPAGAMPASATYKARVWRTDAWRREQERERRNGRNGKSLLGGSAG